MEKRKVRRMTGFLRKSLGELKLGKVRDSRSRQGRRWDLSQVLGAVLLGLMSGCQSLAETEELSAELSRALRHVFRLPRRIADTTLRNILCGLSIQSLRGVLHRAIRAAMGRKALAPQTLPFHMVAMDGKATAITTWEGPHAQQKRPERGKPYGLVRTVTSTLTTAPGQPIIDVSPVPAHSNEMGHFETAFVDLVETYPKLFDMISYDAGANSEANAAWVVQHHKHYLFHMANDERHMTQLSKELLSTKRVIATTQDTLNNSTTVKRSLRIMSVYDHSRSHHSSLIWSHTKTILQVESETWKTEGERRHCIARESRVFCSSYPKDGLLPEQWLHAVRLHWGVEISHQIADTAFSEDDRPWISNNSNGMLAVLILRRTAQTLLGLFRGVTLRSEENRSMPWKRLLRWVQKTLLVATQRALAGMRNLEAFATR